MAAESDKATGSADDDDEKIERPLEGVVEVISSTGWYVPGKLQGVPTDFLIDSGSTYTIIDEELYEGLPENVKTPLEPLEMVLRSANGEILKVLGQTNMQLEIGNQTFQYPVKVVALGDNSAILGLDFMSDEECVVYMGNGIMQIGSKSVRIRLHKQSEIKCARIQVEHTVCIPPNHEMIISGKINHRHRNFDEMIGAIEPTKSLSEEKGLLVARALVNTNVSIVPVRLANFNSESVVLEKGQTLAMIHPVDADNIRVLEISECKTGETDQRSVPKHLQCVIDSLPEDLTMEQKHQVENLVITYQDTFTGPDGKVGQTDLVEHTIDVGNARPVKQRHRNVPMHLQSQVDEELVKLEENGEIEDSTSPWSSPLVIVPKKDGKLRICTDYRRLNEVTEKDAYPLPLVSECLTSLSGGRYFNTLDLAQGYHQVRLAEPDKAKTAFSTRRGLKHWNVMPFGLCNAPGTFQRLMEVVLNGLQWERLILYLDDVIVFASTWDETMKNLEMVLKRFRQAKLTLKPAKCKLMQHSVEFLGHIVSQDGIQCDPKKLEAVREWQRPLKVKDVRSFVAFCQYYRKHIKAR